MTWPEGQPLYGPYEIGIYTVKEANRLRNIRTSLQNYKPSKDEVERAVVHSIPQLEEKFLAFVTQHPEQAREVIANYRKFAAQLYKPMTNAELAARLVLDQIALALHRFALQLYQQSGHPGYFVFYYDLAEGVLEACGSIIHSHGDRMGRTDQITSQSLHETEKNQGTEFSPETYGEVYVKLRGEFVFARRMITEDPTGFTLVDFSVEDLKAEIVGKKPSGSTRRLVGYEIPEFVLGGAQLGQKAYKTVYTLLTT